MGAPGRTVTRRRFRGDLRPRSAQRQSAGVFPVTARAEARRGGDSVDVFMKKASEKRLDSGHMLAFVSHRRAVSARG
jgi:hypothetical protein